MKQGTDWVYVKVSLELFDQMKEWSRPVILRLEEDYSGDITLVSKTVDSMSLRELKKVL